MKIVKEFPPNIVDIRAVLNPPEVAIFAYNDTIYNPSGVTIYEDLMVHEEIHEKQQREMGGASVWWIKYLTDKRFRLSQEVEAYSKQYSFLKKTLLNKHLKEALQEMAYALSHDYNLGITYQEAESRIRSLAKNI